MGLHLRKRADKTGPEPPRDADGNLLQPWPLAGVEATAPLPDSHRFATSIVYRGIDEDWITTTTDDAGDVATITLHLDDGDAVYRVDHQPGIYCCFCDAKLGRWPANPRVYPEQFPTHKSAIAENARRRAHAVSCSGGDPDRDDHLASPSPDAQNPNGWRHDDFFHATKRS